MNMTEREFAELLNKALDDIPREEKKEDFGVGLYEIYNFVYEDVCSDSWYGKDGKEYHIGFVSDTEENVKALVDEINANRGSIYPHDPEDEYDYDCDDANYIAYHKVFVSSFDKIKENWRCKR